MIATRSTGYRRRLAGLDADGSLLLAPADVRLLLLTGQSSFSASNLSAAQTAFLETVAPAGAAIVRAGFPFHASFLADPPPPAPALPAAAVRNALQVVWSVRSAGYRQSVGATLQRAVDASRRRLLVVTGSCGLEIMNRAWAHLRLPGTLDVRIVALGPACLGTLRLEPAKVTVLRGSADGWSRLLYRGRIDGRLPCGHLGYWTCPETRARVAEILR